MNDPTLFDQLKLYLALVITWLGGEIGRLAVAGAAGGLVRALMSERRRFRDGVLAVIAGALMARYATPVTLAMLESYLGALKGDVVGAAGFATGIMGMSLAKFTLGILEAQTKRINGGHGDA